MKKIHTLTIAAVSPLLLASGMGVANAAQDPSEVVIPALDAEYIGPLSSAGKMPKVEVEADEVSRAFTKMVNYKSVAKVVKATDGEASEEGHDRQGRGLPLQGDLLQTGQPGHRWGVLEGRLEVHLPGR